MKRLPKTKNVFSTKLLSTLLIIIFSLNVYAQDEKEKKLILLKNEEINIIKNENLMKFELALALGIASDELIRNGLREKLQNNNAQNVSLGISKLGLGVSAVPIGGYFVGKMLGDLKLEKTSYVASQSLLISFSLTTAIKYLVGRKRPNVADNAYTFKPFTSAFDETWDSFPSGHATIAWSVVTPYAIDYKNDWLYLVPVAVSLARIYDEKHWSSDVILGSGIGFATGYILSGLNDGSFEFDGTSVKVKF